VHGAGADECARGNEGVGHYLRTMWRHPRPTVPILCALGDLRELGAQCEFRVAGGCGVVRRRCVRGQGWESGAGMGAWECCRSRAAPIESPKGTYEVSEDGGNNQSGCGTCVCEKRLGEGGCRVRDTPRHPVTHPDPCGAHLATTQRSQRPPRADAPDEACGAPEASDTVREVPRRASASAGTGTCSGGCEGRGWVSMRVLPSKCHLTHAAHRQPGTLRLPDMTEGAQRGEGGARTVLELSKRGVLTHV